MYAVVKFVEEGTVSEVPDSWLVGVDQCWWPSKNAKHLIQKGISPGTGNSSWNKHDVVIEDTCLSYEVARRKTIHYNISSSDESSKGRGKRQVIRTVDDNYNYDSDSSEPPSILTNIPKLTRQIVTNTKVTPTAQRKNITYSQPDQECITKWHYTKVNSQPLLDITNAPAITVEELYQSQEDCEDPLKIVSQGSEHDSEQRHEVLNIIDTRSDSESIEKNSTGDQILRLLVKISLRLDCIDQRISNLEKHNKPNENEDNRFKFIKELLPITFDTIANVNSLLLSNSQLITQLKDFLQTVGGHNPRDNIHRILSRLFSNECATKCSWKGFRNNFKVFDLKVIAVMKEVLVASFSYVTQHEIEQVASEWFRFAKQRYERENKCKASLSVEG